jgi:nucleotide-binding universal stress UspA family protein
VWQQDAKQRLATAFDEAFGGYPDDVAMQPRVVRGQPGPMLVQVAEGDGTLLVIGAGHRRLFRRRLHGPTTRFCLAHAAGPVVLVPPPELVYERLRVRKAPFFAS